MKVLLTGSNGFIGSYIANELKKHFYIVGCDLSDFDKNNLDLYYKWKMGDESIPPELENEKFDVIIHTAACLDMDDSNVDLLKVNCIGTHQLFVFAKKAMASSVILLSSIPMVGNPVDTIDENSPINPKTLYHSTKYMQELILKQLEKYNIRFASLRIPSPVGPNQPIKTIVPRFIQSAINGNDILLYGKGTRRQNYVDVRDIACYVTKMALCSKINGVYVLGSNSTVSNYELAEKCIKYSNSRSKIVFCDVPDDCDEQVWRIDSSKINNLLGMSLSYSIDETIKDMIKIMKK